MKKILIQINEKDFNSNQCKQKILIKIEIVSIKRIIIIIN